MRSRAEEAVTVSVCFKSGLHQRLVCANMKEARRVWNCILDAINAFLPYAVVEDSTSSVMFATAEIASVSYGVPAELLRVTMPPERAMPPILGDAKTVVSQAN